MSNYPVGISNISMHIPNPFIEISRITAERVQKNPRLGRHLDRACRTTGQRAIRFPEIWEDSATMAAQAALRVIADQSELDLSLLRYLSVGTETGLDHSKPLSAYVEGMLQAAGLSVPESLSSFQVQHACAGGTVALMSVAALLAMGRRPGESGLVICSDIARYRANTTAEITQGAGAVALLVEPQAQLIELDLAAAGYHSRDVDDFFRPLGSHTAQVNGRFSMQCYLENLEAAFLDHCRRRDGAPAQVLANTDLFVLHTPFRNMPEQAMQSLLKRHLGLSEEQGQIFLAERGFYAGINPVARIGNIYSGSMYLSLAFLLQERFRALGEKIVGKNILMASYGSGNTMIVLSGKIAPNAPEILWDWDLDKVLVSGRQATFQDYHLWMESPYGGASQTRLREENNHPAGAFFLAGIREDGYREYKYKPNVRDWIPESQASVDLHQPAAVSG